MTKHEPVPLKEEDIETGSLVKKRDLDRPDIKTGTKCDKIRIRIFWTIFLLLLLFVFYTAYRLHEEEHKYDHLLKTEDEIINEMKKNETGRRGLRGFFHHHQKQCSDHRFGCCKIHDICYETDDGIRSESYDLNLHYIVKEDEQGSNCPTLKDLVTTHNKVYNMNHTASDEEYGDCYIDTTCSESFKGGKGGRLRVNRVTNEYLQSDILCPTPKSLVHEYNFRWPDEYTGGPDAGDIAILIALGIFVCSFISSKCK